MATRYDQKTKDKVVAFITDYNQKNGRGGQSAAAKKWKINPITVKSWMEKAGVASPGKSSRKKTSRKKAATTTRKARTTRETTNSIADVLKRMAAIHAEIGKLQKEYDGLKAKL